MSNDATAVPSLQTLCIEAAASSDFWRVQTRFLEALREDHVNSLVDELIKRGRLPPKSLYKFRNTSLTEITIDRDNTAHLGKWIGCMSYLSHLRAITLKQERFSRSWWQPLATWSVLAPKLQSLTLEGLGGFASSSSTLNRTLGSTLAFLTSLTSLKLDSYSGYIYEQIDVRINFNDLAPLSLLVSIHLHDVRLSSPDTMSSLVHLSNLRSISLSPYTKGEEFCDYAPGVLYLGSLPKLEHFEFTGPLSCPPVSSTLTSLDWTITWIENVIDDDAELAWIDMAPKLKNLCKFKFSSRSTEPEGICTIVENIVSGAAASLTSLSLWPYGMKSDGAFLSQCINLKSLEILARRSAVKSFYPEITIPSLSIFMNLTNLRLEHTVTGCSLSTVVANIRLLTNLEKLDLCPGDLRITGELARGGVLQNLKHLSIAAEEVDDDRYLAFLDNIVDEDYCGATTGMNIVKNCKEVMAVDDENESTPTQFALPSLKTLLTCYYACSLDVWKCLASLAPGIEHLTIDGTKERRIYSKDTLKDIHFKREVKVCDQLQMIAQSFPNLKWLGAGTQFGSAVEFVLGESEIAIARTTPLGDFDLPLDGIQQIEVWRKEPKGIVDVEYLEPLSAEVLEFDERYRYSMEELKGVGEKWKNSVQGKKEIMKLRGKLADGVLVV